MSYFPIISERSPFGSKQPFIFPPQQLHGSQEEHPGCQKGDRSAFRYRCARLKTKSLTVLTIRPAGGEAPGTRCRIETIPAGAPDSRHIKEGGALRDNRRRS